MGMNKKKDRTFDAEALAGILSPAMIIAAAMVLISILLIAIGVNPLAAIGSLIKGAFGSPRGIINTISKSVPICLSAFAVAFAKKVGVFNIGVEGQLIMGAIGSAIAGIYLTGLPAAIHLPLSILCGMLCGVLYAAIPTHMYVKKQTNLMVLFIMMNNLAKLLCTYVIMVYIKDSASMTTASLPIQESAYLPDILTSPAKLNIGVLILLAVGICIYIFFYKTVWGYEMTVCGLNRGTASYSGIPTKKYITMGLLIGGALAGLAGSIEVQGTYYRLYDGFSPGYGFDGIPIALLANNNPLFMFIGSILFAALRVGSNTMQIEQGVPSELVSVIQGILITLIACEYIIHYLSGKLLSRKKEA